ncbi:MAG: nicotinate (nicotinamide) nucleotide adenylyltransferase [Planctomycetota bacterium]|nr:MAG: nicotinate (nicotinamide) nucleotide adenylyltransferase [Planctomycetota bacterium]
MEQIGLLGGAFDPIHWGHIQLCKEAVQRLNLDQIQFLPSYEHPFKGQKYLFTFEQRCQLINLAIDETLNETNASCNQVESQLEGTNYTYKTISWLKEQNKNSHYTFFIGTDNLTQLHLWKNILDLPSICDIVCFARQGFETQAILNNLSNHFAETFCENIINNLIEISLPEISSTEIKSAISTHKLTPNMLPSNCVDYIEELKA